ncbi:MAG TPA: HD domain-containing phosphohydrolase [Anaerolineales bacterium]|nr:HD domain-containing phosphohydrolase [Anaerolineales bacterium]
MSIDRALTYLPPILGAIIYGVLELIVALSKPKTRLKTIFQLYLLAMFLWSVSAFMTLSGSGDVLTWFRIMTIAPITMTIAFFYFVQTLFGLRQKWATLVLLYGIVLIPLSLFTPYLIRDAAFDGGTLHYEFGPLLFLAAVPGYSLNFLSLGQLANGYSLSSDINQRNRFRYLILALSITILATLINFTEWGKYPIDIAANTLTAMLIAYAILRHKLLDIQIVIRLGILYSVTTTILGLIYFLAITLTLNFVQSFSGERIFLLSVIVAILTAVIISPLREAAQSWVDRLFYRERYNAGLMLQRLSQTTASLLDLGEITKVVLSDVARTLHINHVAMFIKHGSDNSFHLLAEKGTPELPAPIFSFDHPIIKWMSLQNRILSRNALDISPIFRSLWKGEMDYLNQFSAELFIPLTTKGKLVGFIIAGAKRSTESYTHDEEVILSTLANQTAVVIENARLYEDLEATFVQTVVTLANAIDMRDTYTSDHSQRIAEWAAEIARALGCDRQDVQAIYWGGLLHDVGKIAIPDSILRKPGPLDEHEWEIIRKHTILGAALVSPIKKLANVAPIIEYSHERFDGSGYPYGLKGEEIPLGARIIGIVDSYSAMRDERSYKEPISHDEAIAELKRNSGTLFDPQLLAIFLRVIEEGR